MAPCAWCISLFGGSAHAPAASAMVSTRTCGARRAENMPASIRNTPGEFTVRSRGVREWRNGSGIMKDVPPHDRPREKLARVGASALGDNELIALVLGHGTSRADALTLANALLARAGGVRGLARAGLAQVLGVPGVGTAHAARVLAAIEHFGALLLDGRNRLLRTAVVSIGTLDASVIHPRDIFREAALEVAAGVVLFHNHPSGDPTPSPEDVLITRRMVHAGVVMGIEVLDHLVLAETAYFSFRENRQLS